MCYSLIPGLLKFLLGWTLCKADGEVKGGVISIGVDRVRSAVKKVIDEKKKESW